MNLAALESLPLVFRLPRNNQWAQWVPSRENLAAPSIARLADGYGIPGVLVDGQDVRAVHAAASAAATRARSGGGPTLIECDTQRYYGHNIGDMQVYRSRQGDRRAARAHRPGRPPGTGTRGVGAADRGSAARPAGLDRRRGRRRHCLRPREPDARSRGPVRGCVRRLPPRRRHAEGPMIADLADAGLPATGGRPDSDIPRGHCRGAARGTPAQSGPVHPRRGLDPAGRQFRRPSRPRGGVSRPDRPDPDRGGPPSSARRSARPWPAGRSSRRSMFTDFITCCMDEIANQAAKLRYMSGGQADLPLVIRSPCGMGKGTGAQHTQSLEAWFRPHSGPAGGAAGLSGGRQGAAEERDPRGATRSCSSNTRCSMPPRGRSPTIRTCWSPLERHGLRGPGRT